MAASTTVYSTTPLAGVKLSDKGSTMPGNIAVLTKVNGNNGHVFILANALVTVGSITTVKIGPISGSASVDSGSAGWTANVAGGAVAGQKFWAQRTTLA